MSLFAIADLHLSLSVNKPMDIFGERWSNHVEKLTKNWNETVSENDIVVIPGDISWAINFDEAKADFDYINKLNGTKIISKGNHDYWWETMSKLNKYVTENEYDNIFFLHNNSYTSGSIAICGTRGWNLPVSQHFSNEDEKIYAREIQRLDMSLTAADDAEEKIVFTHFPPICAGFVQNPFTDVLKKHNVKTCVYGHLHANSSKNALTGLIGNINYLLVSCDYLDFNPVKLSD